MTDKSPLAIDSTPIRPKDVKVRLDGQNVEISRHSRKQLVRTNQVAAEMLEMCNGRRTIADIAGLLAKKYIQNAQDIQDDVLGTLEIFFQQELIENKREPDNLAEESVRLDLRTIPAYVINLEEDADKLASMKQQLGAWDIDFKVIKGVKCQPAFVGIALSHLKILNDPDIKTPFIIFEDDCEFLPDFSPVHTLPEKVEGLYLGVSRFGLKTPGVFGWGVWDATITKPYSPGYLRIMNMLARHAVVVISESYRQTLLENAKQSLLNKNNVYPGDIGFALAQNDHLVVTPASTTVVQSARFKGNYPATRALSPPDKQPVALHKVQPSAKYRKNGKDFYLYLDIFVHFSGTKICAVAPWYGQDLDWKAAGIDLDRVTLVCDSISVQAKCIRYRLDSWEPSIVFDFEHEGLALLLRENSEIEFSVFAGSLHKKHRLSTEPVANHDHCMSVIVRDENRWLPHYLNYYLNVLKADHVYVYDNFTRDKQRLNSILKPYRESGRVTLINWPYRWRNSKDGKQIGQPPHQVHSLNKYGRARWIGFFDVDEFLRLPGHTISSYLADYDPGEIGGVSFGLRWYFYQGDLQYQEISNPLLEFHYHEEHKRGRKGQKLFVSPKNVRFMRFHWIQEDQVEIPILDENIYFHHYAIREERFYKGLEKSGLPFDDYMTQFQEILEIEAQPVIEPPKPATVDYILEKPVTVSAWRRHLVKCLEMAEEGKSKLNQEVLQLRGMSGDATRHFYNNLCSFKECRYLEVGSWRGSTLAAATYGNAVNAICIDNWSEFAFDKSNHPRASFNEVRNKYCQNSDVTLIESDCFSVSTENIHDIDVFLYDGAHDEKSHYRAVKHFFPCLSQSAVVIIDDWNWPSVREGTHRALDELKAEIGLRTEILLPKEETRNMPQHEGRKSWWNGIAIFLIIKD